MAITKLSKNGYGQLELNQVAFRRDGRIEAQAKLDNAEGGDFASDKLENGMIVAVDPTKKIIKKPTTTNAGSVNYVFGLAYSAEHQWDERKIGLKDFALPVDDAYGFLPRIGYFAVGDKFTTNTVAFDGTRLTKLRGTEATAVEKKLADGNAVYAGIGDGTGYWVMDTGLGTVEGTTYAINNGVIARVVEVTTMPDGQDAVKLEIVRV